MLTFTIVEHGQRGHTFPRLRISAPGSEIGSDLAISRRYSGLYPTLPQM
jgi:hypothetical protein